MQIKPRAKQLNDVLVSRKGGRHQADKGKTMSRARLKQQDRRYNNGSNQEPYLFVLQFHTF